MSLPLDVLVCVAKHTDVLTQMRMSITCKGLYKRIGVHGNDSQLTQRDLWVRFAICNIGKFGSIHPGSYTPASSYRGKCILFDPRKIKWIYDLRSHSVCLYLCSDEVLQSQWFELTFRRDLEPKHIAMIKYGMENWANIPSGVHRRYIDHTCPYIPAIILANWINHVNTVKLGWLSVFDDINNAMDLEKWDPIIYTEEAIMDHILNNNIPEWFVTKHAEYFKRNLGAYLRVCDNVPWDIAQHFPTDNWSYPLALSAPVELLTKWEGHPGHQISSYHDHILTAFCQRCSIEHAHKIAPYATERDWTELSNNPHLDIDFFKKYIDTIPWGVLTLP